MVVTVVFRLHLWPAQPGLIPSSLPFPQFYFPSLPCPAPNLCIHNLCLHWTKCRCEPICGCGSMPVRGTGAQTNSICDSTGDTSRVNGWQAVWEDPQTCHWLAPTPQSPLAQRYKRLSTAPCTTSGRWACRWCCCWLENPHRSLSAESN